MSERKSRNVTFMVRSQIPNFSNVWNYGFMGGGLSGQAAGSLGVAPG